jgi:hypothetical protein
MKRLSDPDFRTEMAPPLARGRNEASEEQSRAIGVDASVFVPYLRRVVEGFVAVVAAFAVSVFLTWPLLFELDDHIFGLGGDSTGTMAGIRQWANETGFHITGVSHVASAGAPFGYDNGNGVNVQSAFVFLPAYLIAEVAGEVLAYNFIVLSGLVLSGTAMYWLVRWLGCGPLVAAWSGLVFMVFPWHLEKAQGHVSLAHLEGFPLLLLALFAWHRKPDLRRALLIAGAAAVLWTTSGYFGFMGLVALPPLFMLAVIFHARQVGLVHALRRVAVPLAASLAVPAVVYAIASRGTTETGIAPARQLQELVFYGARPWEYLIPSYRNRLFGDDVGQWLVEHLHGSNFSETSLYVGWLTIILAAGWLVWALVKRSGLRAELRFATLALATTVATGLVFSLPTPLPRTDIPTPVRLIWEVAPQFRVPARFVALVMAALVPLAALALDAVRVALWKHLQPRVLAAGAAGGVCVAAMLLSFLELSISPPAIVTDLSPAPPEYAAVRRASPGILAEYPLAPAGHPINSDYLFWQRVHGRRILNGAQLGTFADAVGQALVDPTAPGTPGALATLGVSVIIVRPPAALSKLEKRYRHLATTPTGTTVWQVTERPAPAIAVFASDFYPPETLTPGSTMRWMGNAGRVELYATRAGEYNIKFTVYSYGRPRRLRLHGRNGSRTVEAPPAFHNMSVPVSLARGRSSLLLTALPGPESLPDGRRATVYMSNWRFEPASTTEKRGRLVPLRATLS